MADLITPYTILALITLIAIALALGLRLAKDPSYGIVLMAFFLPFERIPSLDLAGFTFKINHFLGVLTFIFWALAVLLARRKISPNPISIPLLLFFASFFYTGLQAENLFRHVTVAVSMLLMLVIHLATVNGVTSKQVVERLVGALFIAAGLMTLVGLYQFLGDMIGLPHTVTGLDPGYTKAVFSFPRIHAFSKEPLYYANYLFIPLGVGLALFFSKLSAGTTAKSQNPGLGARLTGPLLLPLMILLFINFFLTLSRGAFIALVPFILIFALFYARQIFTWRNIILGCITILISVTAVYNILRVASPIALERFVNHAKLQDVLVQKTGESGFGRLLTFKQAIDAWQTKPVLGIGLGNFGPYTLGYPKQKPVTGWQIVNNEYLELLAETGVVGLGLWLLCLAIILDRSWQAYRRATDEYLRAVLVGLTAALVAILVQYNFFSTLYIIHIWVLLGIIIGVQNIILVPKRLATDQLAG